MKSRMNTTVVDGATSGQITLRISWISLSVSIRAASISSVGMRWRPARNTSVGKPTQAQAFTKMSAGSAVSACPSQGCASPPSPTAPSVWFTAPKIGWKNSFHRKPMMTVDRITGRNTAIRWNRAPGRSRQSA